MKRSGGLSERFEGWLLGTMPPLSGRLRFVFYGGSLALFVVLNDGLSFTLSRASPYLYQPRGITAFLGVPSFAPGAMRALMAVTYLAWLCAAVGLFTRPAKILTAGGVLLAIGFEQAYETGSTHVHTLLVYVLVLLCFSDSDREWSVDAWLRRRRGLTQEAEGGVASIGATGLPRQAILMAVVGLYFGSGLSKLVDAGPRWIDGQSLQYYIGSQVDRTSFEIITALRMWVSEQRWLCQILSLSTLVIELGAPIALFSRRLRHLWIPAWISMHLGIVLLMAPNYWIHSWCVGVLLTDWAWLRHTLETRSFFEGDRPRLESVLASPGQSMRVRALGGALVVMAAVPPVVQIEWFPVTHVPMYSSYVTPDVVGGVPVEDFGDETRVRELAGRCSGSRAIGYPRRCPWRVPRALADRLTLELLRPGREPERFSGDLGGLRYPAIERLAADSEREESESTVELEQRVRAFLRAEPAGSLSGYDLFQLEYRLSDGTILLANGALEESR